MLLYGQLYLPARITPLPYSTGLTRVIIDGALTGSDKNLMYLRTHDGGRRYLVYWRFNEI